jgi:hypothetical protein
LRPNRFIQTLAAVAFGLGFLGFGIAGFLHIDSSERRIGNKLQSIQAGRVQPEMLTVIKKYVNPGRSGLPHIVFSSARQPQVDMPTTPGFFNSTEVGEIIRGYYFPEGYFIPETREGTKGLGKWLFLGVGVFAGGGALVLARATARRP